MDGTTTGSDNRVGIQLKLLSRLLKWSKSKKKAADVHRPNLDLNIEHCDVCYDENLMGYKLACGHSRCVECMRKSFQAALDDNTLIPPNCCSHPIDTKLAMDLLDPNDANLILVRAEEKEAKNKMYCPSCTSFMNLDLVDSTEGSDLLCSCGMSVCVTCKTESHRGYTCRQNQAIVSKSGSDELLLELSKENGWKRCPKCSIVIEKKCGCDHMTCRNCSHQFCYKCLGPYRRCKCNITRVETFWERIRFC